MALFDRRALRRNYYGNIHAPEFPPDVEWVNTREGVSLAQLRGRVVLLEFWTYGCINCIHSLPDLKRLEQEFGQDLVVIGVHSAKFGHEGQLESLRQIVARYELAHPVVNDNEMRIWNAYAVRAWPTTILIGPDGRVIAARSGEGVYEALHVAIAEAIQAYRDGGSLDREPVDLTMRHAPRSDTELLFPGKVLADEAGNRLYVSDTNHNRIAVLALDGQVLDVIGSGEPGLVDGSFEEARFRKPQGTALRGGALYIADTENHAIRAADLMRRTVRSVAGDGVIGRGQMSSSLEESRLNSPWDLTVAHDRVYVAMAGLHQTWVLDEDARSIEPFAGSGREALLDGPLASAALAQPSGITTDDERLFVADSEASAVRAIDLGAPGRVATLIGEGLFAFGDEDGVWPGARLQHPLGVLHHGGRLYVADTYNHKIKVVDPKRGEVTTLTGDGNAGNNDGLEARFDEPGGLAGAQRCLYVADTNNHAIRVMDLQTNGVHTLPLVDPKGLLAGKQNPPLGRALRHPVQRVRPGDGEVRISVGLPDGYKLSPMALSRLVWRQLPDTVDLDAGAPVDLSASPEGTSIPVHFGEPAGPRDHLPDVGSPLVGEVALYYCQSLDDVRLIHLAVVELPVLVEQNASNRYVDIHISVPETRA